MAAEITINQPLGAGAGDAGKARQDIWLDKEVELVSSGDGSAFLWELIDRPLGSLSELADAETALARFTPDKVGTYRIRLTIDESEYVVRVVRCRYDSSGVLTQRGWALPAIDEQLGEANYDTNERHWAEVWETIMEDIRLNGMSGITLGGDLGDWTPASQDKQRVVGVDTITAHLTLDAEVGKFVRVNLDVPAESPRPLLRDGDLLWIGQHSQASNVFPLVFVMSLVDNTLVTRVDLSAVVGTVGDVNEAGARDIAQDDDYIYVACWQAGNVAIIDKATYEVVGWGALYDAGSTRRQCTSVAADGAGNFYCLGWAYDTGTFDYVYGIFKWATADCIGAAPDTEFPSAENSSIVSGEWDYSRKIRYDGGYLWVTAGYSGQATLRKVDPTTLSVVASSSETLKGMNLAFDGGYIYVTEDSNETIIRYDTSCVAQASADLSLYFNDIDSMVFDDLGSGKVYITGVKDGTHVILDTASMGGLLSLVIASMPSDRWGDVISYNGDFIVASFTTTAGGGGGF